MKRLLRHPYAFLSGWAVAFVIVELLVTYGPRCHLL